MKDLEWATVLSEKAKQIYGCPNGEAPYSDTSPIGQGWTGRFDWYWNPLIWGRPYFSLQVCRGSKNWSMGTLNFDVFFFALEIGPLDFFFAYRLEVRPPIPMPAAIPESQEPK